MSAAESVLVTGGAGFIGSTLIDRLLAEGRRVVALDAFDPYYPDPLKLRNLAGALASDSFELVRADIRDAEAMGARLAARGWSPDAVITSPALRARTTAEILASALGTSVTAEDERIYEASLRTLYAVVESLDDACDDVMIVGHNPGFTELADSLGDRAVDGLPTCAVVRLRLNIDQWMAAAPACGEVLGIDTPKDDG